jgi:hypothetical protein
MNWKNYVEKTQAKTYVLPPGWDSRAKVASDLDCSEENVRRMLAPAMKAGEVEMASFPVWDEMTKRIVRTTAYRRVEAVPQKNEKRPR